MPTSRTATAGGLVQAAVSTRPPAQPVERAFVRLKDWRIFRHARCSPIRLTAVAAAVLTLEQHR
ncbi:hypothetical protein GCM10010405_23540 [Streptomyces macrosporus]|uniref:Transposase n=1 Tax=Streptomyces macrosporus TaxID=44032 RepID=A0ABP5X103_9ACTN